jgi:hypothetical protein
MLTCHQSSSALLAGEVSLKPGLLAFVYHQTPEKTCFFIEKTTPK